MHPTLPPQTGLRVLVAPLNWGLGHATRCVPIIRELLEQGAEVFLACDMEGGEVLRGEFPQLPYFELPSYKVHYKTHNMVWNLALQFPKIMTTILKEHIEIEKLVAQEQIDAVITDNRFGCYSRRAFSVFMTHQVNVLVPNKLTERTVRYLNRKFMKRFDMVWIPDYADSPNLSGSLSHGMKRGNYTYLGPLSRMEPCQAPEAYDLAIVLSGPEPQRTHFERIILAQIPEFDGRAILVRGKPQAEDLQVQSGNLEIRNYCKGDELNAIIASAPVVLCRSGYSTVMDLAVLGKKAIMVPTPGQTEQEYLSQILAEQGIIHEELQKTFDLRRAMNEVENTLGFEAAHFQDNQLQAVLSQFIQQLQAERQPGKGGRAKEKRS